MRILGFKFEFEVVALLGGGRMKFTVESSSGQVSSLSQPTELPFEVSGCS